MISLLAEMMIIAQTPSFKSSLKKIEVCQKNQIKKSFSTLNNINLYLANLENVNFNSCHIESSNFAQANLKKTKFNGVLWNNNFRNANLQQTEIQGTVTSTFTKANLSDANLSGVFVNEGSFEHADFLRANLTNIQFASTNLDDASFVNANLSFAKFISNYGNDLGTSLVNAQFKNTNLQKAIFGSYTNLENTDLTGANLAGALIIKVENLTAKQVKSACYWEEAIYNFDSSRNPFVLDITEEDLTATQKFILELKQDKTSDPKIPVDCSHWVLSG